MNSKYYTLIGGILALVTSFAFGRYSAPVKTETKIVTIEKVNEEKIDNSTKVEEIKPDGTKIITTKNDIKTKTITDTNKSDGKITESNKPKTTLSFISGYNIDNKYTVYGLYSTIPVLGPIQVSFWGHTNTQFTSKTVGASLGFQF